MINSVACRFVKNFRFRDKLYFCVYRRETTSLMKTKNEVQEQWEKKMKFYMKTYEDLFGLTKLSEIHDRVIEIQTSLQVTQEKRRKVQENIFIVQKKLQEMQDILHKTSMGDDMYISVVTQVRELLKEQKRLQDTFSLYDQTEREQQTTLAMAINNSQDHERTYREKNKYLSLITGIVGGILGLVGSSINNWRHRKDIKHFASDISDQVVDLQKSVEKLKLVVSPHGMILNAATDQSVEAEDILSTIKSQHNMLDQSLKSLQTLVTSSNIGTNNPNQKYDGHIEEVLNEFEGNIKSNLNNHTFLNLGLLLIGVCWFYMTRSS